MAEKHPITFEEFAQVMVRMSGCRAWRSAAGAGTGSIFTLQLGLPLEHDDQEGEFSLMVYCAWRIVKAGQVLCTWHEDSSTVLAPALQTLWDCGEVTGATLSEWGDLTIQFQNGQQLQVWNDAPFTQGECWSVGYQGRGYYVVEAPSQFVYETNNEYKNLSADS